MDIRQLEALVGIADYGTFSATAEVLGTVQSNISSRIAHLEKELNTQLVDRSTGALTPSGAIVVARARRILSEVSSVATDVEALDAQIRGQVSVGTIGTTGRWIIPQLLSHQRATYPFISLSIFEGTNSTLEPQLVTGRLDLAVLAHPVISNDLAETHLFTEDLVLVVPNAHPLAQRSAPIPLIELGELDLLLPLTGTALRRSIDQACQRAGVVLRPIIELDGVRTLASLTFDGHGPAILPATAMSSHIRPEFVALAVEGLQARKVALANRRYGFPSTPVRAIRELIIDMIGNSDELPLGLHAAPHP